MPLRTLHVLPIANFLKLIKMIVILKRTIEDDLATVAQHVQPFQRKVIENSRNFKFAYLKMFDENINKNYSLIYVFFQAY